MFLCLIEFLSFRNEGQAFVFRVTVMNDKPADCNSVESNAKQKRDLFKIIRYIKIEEEKDLYMFSQKLIYSMCVF